MKYLKWLLSFTSRTANIVFVVLMLISLSASYISPNKIWFLPFWGLLLPFFVFIWILRKRYFAVVSLLAIGTCLPQLFKLGATNIIKQKIHSPQSPVIKIMSYNVRDFDLYNWSENVNSKEKIFQTIKEKDP